MVVAVVVVAAAVVAVVVVVVVVVVVDVVAFCPEVLIHMFDLINFAPCRFVTYKNLDIRLKRRLPTAKNNNNNSNFVKKKKRESLLALN